MKNLLSGLSFFSACRQWIHPVSLILAFTWGLSPGIALATEIIGQTEKEDPVSTTKQETTLKVINYLISKSHYRSVDLDDEFSARVLVEYLDQLDPTKSFFLAEDIEQFYRFEDRMDDFIQQGNLQPAFLIYKIYRNRVDQIVDYATKRLKQPFDFSRHEEFALDRQQADWPEAKEELQDIWRKRIKNDMLNLRLTGKDHDEILETLESRYFHISRRTNQLESEDIFQIFTNAYVNSIEPHTSYYSPRATENFKINMRLSLEGIGAVLQNDNEYTQIRRVVPGGPADLSGELQSKDRILGVGQGDEDIVDVIGWRLDDVVGLIRGPKNSIVRLQILPGESGLNGKTRIISLVRDEIRLEEQAARKEVLTVETHHHTAQIGLIQLPSFYIDFEGMYNGDPEYRSTTRDVRRLLKEFQTEDISGLVIDLRGNGGGSLREAIELTGLFIHQGPVVQVKSSNGKIKVDQDPDPEIVYDGPLAVLVDGYSASASEIFAGAIQDYHRGLIIGEPTFGKGTVQNLFDLERFVKSEGDLGQLKLTIAQFFRVNGDSTQFRGVTPDFILMTTDEDFGERSFDHAIPWQQIRKTTYTPFGVTDDSRKRVLEMTRQVHQQRIAEDPEFRYYNETSRINQQQRQLKTVSLHEATRSQERTALNNQRIQLENRKRRALGERPILSIDALGELDTEYEEQAGTERRADFFAKESARILSDYVYFSRIHPSGQGSIVAKHSTTH